MVIAFIILSEGTKIQWLKLKVKILLWTRLLKRERRPLAPLALESRKQRISPLISANIVDSLPNRISTAKGSTMVSVMRWGNIIIGVALILCYPIGLMTKKATLGFTSTFMMVYCM